MTADEAYILMEAIRDYFEERAEADDGQPNHEMKLQQDADSILLWLETMP